jgi:hypothetical protein
VMKQNDGVLPVRAVVSGNEQSIRLSVTVRTCEGPGFVRVDDRCPRNDGLRRVSRQRSSPDNSSSAKDAEDPFDFLVGNGP